MNNCFICLHNDDYVNSLRQQNVYMSNCRCNGNVHMKCLATWYEIHNNCPICRINVHPKTKWMDKITTYIMTTYYITLNGVFLIIFGTCIIQHVVYSCLVSVTDTFRMTFFK